MRLIDVSEYSCKGAEINWIEHDYHTINIHRKPLYEIPTVDAAPVKHGRWMNMRNGNADCSVCGRHVIGVYDDDNADKYCRFCGAYMDLEE